MSLLNLDNPERDSVSFGPVLKVSLLHVGVPEKDSVICIAVNLLEGENVTSCIGLDRGSGDLIYGIISAYGGGVKWVGGKIPSP